MLCCKNSREIAALSFSDEAAEALLEQLEQAHDNLSARKLLIEDALLRLAFWAKIEPASGDDAKP